jgi:hypothetical protein
MSYWDFWMPCRSSGNYCREESAAYLCFSSTFTLNQGLTIIIFSRSPVPI